MAGASPLIVTAALDEASFDWFDALRREHFPPGRNLVPAHLTLFHALPGDQEAAAAEAIRSACATTAPMPLSVTGPWSLGRGVAYRIVSPELERLRERLAEAFAPWLVAQDRAPFRPHVTVQNKVAPDAARALLDELQQGFEPFDALAEGLLVWRYRGGPWERLSFAPFTTLGRHSGRLDDAP